MSLFILTDGVNATEHHRIWCSGDVGPEDTHCDTPGEVYRECVKEYGRCTGRMYVDTDGAPKAVGWVFVKREKYQDCDDTYLQETWVTLLDAPDTVTRERHYHYIGGTP
jgi:hypothetical protein